MSERLAQNDQAAGSSEMLVAERLTKRYEDGVLALNDLSLSVAPGEIYAMLGGNGAGKTTTINLFLNFVDPTSGTASVDGIITHEEPLLARQKIAYVSENVMLYTNFTALQNLDYFARLGGQTHYSKSDYRDALLRVGLQEEAHNKRLRDFSKGMRQKCGIAIAILKDAPAILLDEPTSGLDPKAGLEFIGLLDDLRSESKAILMSTHDIFRAKQIANTIGIMNEGTLVMQKTIEELQGENLEELYVNYMVSGLAVAS